MPDNVKPASPLRSVLTVAAVIGAALSLWWASSYLFAYTDDATVRSDVVAVAPEVTGPIVAVHVHDNELVKAGTPLLTIDPLPFQLDLDQSQAAMAQAEAQLPVDRSNLAAAGADLRQAEAELTLAEADLGRAKDLAQRGAGTVQTVDNTTARQKEVLGRLQSAQAAVDRAQQTIRLHESAIATAKAGVALAQWRLDRTQIPAPADGPVSNLTVRVGDMAIAQRPLLGIVDAHAWRVEANYKEWYLRHFRPGMRAWVWLDTMPWHLHRARIQGMSHAIQRDPQPQGLVPYVAPTVNWIRLDRRLPVRIELEDPPPNMRLFSGADARTIVFY